MNFRNTLFICCLAATILHVNSTFFFFKVQNNFESCVLACKKNCKECFFKFPLLLLSGKINCEEQSRNCERDCFNKFDPCKPCGPNAQCNVENNRLICFCKPGFFGNPPNCIKAECVTNSDCPNNKLCQGGKCVSPCESSPNPCGPNSVCRVENQVLKCSCESGFTGSPPNCRLQCSSNNDCELNQICKNNKCINPCETDVCGLNSDCRVENNILKCSCKPGFIGSPPSCRPECTSDSECASDKQCRNNRCVNLCDSSSAVCGPNSDCRTENNILKCSCKPNFIGSPPNCRPECTLDSDCPFDKQCKNIKCVNPCDSSSAACGPNADCKVENNNLRCSCKPGFTGSPPNCRTECTFDSECSFERVCQNSRCVNPCELKVCGLNADCKVEDNNLKCSCKTGFIGSPPNCRQECTIDSDCPLERVCQNNRCINPCSLQVCGPNADCRVENNNLKCSCKPGFIGSPPNCRPECIFDTECPFDKVCKNSKCVNPCDSTSPSAVCGPNADCKVENNNIRCSCRPGFIGSPPNCRPECIFNNDCDFNQICRNNKCISTECKENEDCALDKACKDYKCINPCDNQDCGPNSNCRVENHRRQCSCRPNFIGSPPNCRPECDDNDDCPLDKSCKDKKCINTCENQDCGPNSNCNVEIHRRVCSCKPGFIGSPPNCRRECNDDDDCPLDRACKDSKCLNPCGNQDCGPNSNCRVENHRRVCLCKPGFIGNPPNCRRECNDDDDCPLDRACKDSKCLNPCENQDCGPNSNCRVENHRRVCSCKPGFIGNPPNCRRECNDDDDCPLDRACKDSKCLNPCENQDCGPNSNCRVENHRRVCSCEPGFIGNPPNCRRECNDDVDCPLDKACKDSKCLNPCENQDCGPNSNCRVENHRRVCSCRPDFIGNPPNCRPECNADQDCPSDKICRNNKCVDPCNPPSASCGPNADCRVENNIVKCSCKSGSTGSPPNCKSECNTDDDCPVNRACKDSKCINPCDIKDFCGPNAICKVVRRRAFCFCDSGYTGAPPDCKRECTKCNDCPNHLSCHRNSCIDPCSRHTCGRNARCIVVNREALCECLPGYNQTPNNECVKCPLGEERKTVV